MLKVEGLFVEYADGRGATVAAVSDVSFSVPEGQLFTLLGPSGCGKTTTLRSIAGLERPRAGEISVNNLVVHSSSKGVFVAPNRRGFGMVFQSHAIWPHMDVFQNAAFPLEVGEKRLSRTEIRDKVMRVLAAVQLDDLADRNATKLSGGQQQRLALARALVMEPALLLLDEPLSSLDAKLRRQLRAELKRLQRSLKVTTIYVTHDQAEALALSDGIAVMNGGRIEQVGTPREIYERPANAFVADFVGSANFLEGTALGAVGADHTRVRTEIGDVTVAAEGVRPEARVLVSIHPEDVEIFPSRPDGSNVFPARVEQRVFLGDALELQVRVGTRVLLSRQHPSKGLGEGAAVFARLDPDKCVVLPAGPVAMSS
ncbi:MAG: ABC transporter ATP-binding protein [Usitatibacter sp.]